MADILLIVYQLLTEPEKSYGFREEREPGGFRIGLVGIMLAAI